MAGEAESELCIGGYFGASRVINVAVHDLERRLLSSFRCWVWQVALRTTAYSCCYGQKRAEESVAVRFQNLHISYHITA